MENLDLSWIILIIILAVFEIIMKGITLWKCGRNNQINWYIAILILNTAGILPVIYLMYYQKDQKHIEQLSE
jgi:hypothetical protein